MYEYIIQNLDYMNIYKYIHNIPNLDYLFMYKRMCVSVGKRAPVCMYMCIWELLHEWVV